MCRVSSRGAVLQTGHGCPHVNQQFAEEGTLCDYSTIVPFNGVNCILAPDQFSFSD